MMSNPNNMPKYLSKGSKGKDPVNVDEVNISFNDVLSTGYVQTEVRRVVQKEIQETIPTLIMEVVRLGLDAFDILTIQHATPNSTNVLDVMSHLIKMHSSGSAVDAALTIELARRKTIHCKSTTTGK